MAARPRPKLAALTLGALLSPALVSGTALAKDTWTTPFPGVNTINSLETARPA